jgi:hypothetical protein
MRGQGDGDLNEIVQLRAELRVRKSTGRVC